MGLTLLTKEVILNSYMTYEQFESEILKNISFAELQSWGQTACLFSSIRRMYNKGLTIDQTLSILYQDYE